MIFHITELSEWKKALSTGQYVHPSLATEGFIHCSQEAQVLPTREKYFKGKTGLVLLVIDPQKLTSPLKFELAPARAESFPHIFGPLNLDAVTEVRPLRDQGPDS